MIESWLRSAQKCCGWAEAEEKVTIEYWLQDREIETERERVGMRGEVKDYNKDRLIEEEREGEVNMKILQNRETDRARKMKGDREKQEKN